MAYMTTQEYLDYCARAGIAPDPRIAGAASPNSAARFPHTGSSAAQDSQSGKSAAKASKRKYQNTPVYVYEDGAVLYERDDSHGAIRERFDSVKEYRRCLELRMLQQQGIISELSTQKTLVIQDAFRSKDGTRHKAITYRADFVYVRGGERVVEDVKAFSRKKNKYLTTEVFNIKWKLLQAKYPDYLFELY